MPNAPVNLCKQFVSKFDGQTNNGIPTFTQLRANERAMERSSKVSYHNTRQDKTTNHPTVCQRNFICFLLSRTYASWPNI